MGRPGWRSSLLGDPSAAFLRKNFGQGKKRKKGKQEKRRRKKSKKQLTQS
jgi:hypothetical protein